MMLGIASVPFHLRVLLVVLSIAFAEHVKIFFAETVIKSVCRLSVANQTLEDDDAGRRIQEATERYSQLGSAHDRSGRRKPAVTKRFGDTDDSSKASPPSQSPDRVSLTAPDSSHSLDEDCCSKVRLR